MPCPQCGGTDIDFDAARGDAVCIQCGAVLEENTIVNEVTFAQDAGGSSSVVGQFVSATPGLRSAGLGFAKESREVAFSNGQRHISQLAASLRLADHHQVLSAVRQHQLTTPTPTLPLPYPYPTPTLPLPYLYPTPPLPYPYPTSALPLPYPTPTLPLPYPTSTLPLPYLYPYPTSTLPLPNLYPTPTQPLPYLYPTPTLPHLYPTPTLPLPYPYPTPTLPLPYPTSTLPLPYLYPTPPLPYPDPTSTLPLPYLYPTPFPLTPYPTTSTVTPQEAAQRLFMLAVQHNFIQGRKTTHVIAACLYTVCRREKTSHLLIDYSDVLQVADLKKRIKF